MFIVRPALRLHLCKEVCDYLPLHYVFAVKIRPDIPLGTRLPVVITSIVLLTPTVCGNVLLCQCE